MPKTVLGADQRVTRFLHHHKQIRVRQHYRDFLPRHGETSVAHITGLEEPGIWRLGQNTLNPDAGRSQLLGRADIEVAAVHAIGLRAVRDDVGFVRHAAIVGWPEIVDAEYRQKLLAGRLAAVATLVTP